MFQSVICKVANGIYETVCLFFDDDFIGVIFAVYSMRAIELSEINFPWRPDGINTQASEQAKRKVILLLQDGTRGWEDPPTGRSFLYINPESWFIGIWNCLFLIVFYVVEYQITFSIAFGPTFFEQELGIPNADFRIYISTYVFLLLDFLLSFFRGYYAIGRGRVIQSQSEILKHYLRGQFIVDVSFLVLYGVPLGRINFNLDFVQLIPAFLLWIKKFKYQNELEKLVQYDQTARAILMLFLLFIDAFLFGNYGACIFLGMDLYFYNNDFFDQNTNYFWITNNTSYPVNLIGGIWYYQYIYAQEFSTGTLSTLAPGPFAKNPYEALYAIFLMIIFMILASYIGEVLIQIMFTYTQQRIFHEDNIVTFDNFLKLKGVAQNIRTRIYNFLQLKWEVELKGDSKEQQAIIDQLPMHLRQQLHIELGFIRTVTFINRLSPDFSLQKILAQKITTLTIDGDTTLYRPGQPPDSIYCVREGMLKYCLVPRFTNQSSSSGQVIALSNLERLTGLYQFVTQHNYFLQCRSIDLGQLQRLYITDFLNSLQQLNLWQIFKELQSEVANEGRIELVGKLCLACQQPHLQSKCQTLSIRSKIQEHIKFNSLPKQNHFRKPYARKSNKKKRTLIKMEPWRLGMALIREAIEQETGDQLPSIEVARSYRQYKPLFNLNDCPYQS